MVNFGPLTPEITRLMFTHHKSTVRDLQPARRHCNFVSKTVWLQTVTVLRPGRGHRSPRFAPGSPVSWPPIIFCKITHLIFLRFQIVQKWANLRFPLNVQKPKVLQLQGASPWPPDQGFCPGPHWGLCPQIPVIDSRYRARHGAVPPPPAPRCCGLEPPLVAERHCLRLKNC